MIEKFIESNSNFEIEEIKNINKFFQKFIKKGQFLQVFPNEETDGFFICKVYKKQEKT